MALVESKHISLGTVMPPFKLNDPQGKTYDSRHLYGNNGLLVAFTCNHCPYALAIWPRLIALAKYAKGLGINAVAINPNINPDYPEDAPDKMSEKIKLWGINFPYLVDGTQATARAFDAQCTPDLYLFDGKQHLVYHGRLDDNWKEEGRVTRQELKEAIDNLVDKRPIDPAQKPSLGCSIKWL